MLGRLRPTMPGLCFVEALVEFFFFNFCLQTTIQSFFLFSFNQSVDFDKLPPLTPEYFFSFFEPIMTVLKLTQKSPRFLKDWSEHIVPQQELARKQAKEGKLVHQSKQGRPQTVMPLWQEVKMPTELLNDKGLLVTPAGNDVPPHMFPKKRKTERANEYGHHDYYYFNPFMVIAGPQIRLTIVDKFKFDKTEIEVLSQLTTQYDKKLKEEMKINERKAAAAAAAAAALAPPGSPGICIPCDSDSSEDEDEEERKRRRREERKAKRMKPVEGGVAPCSALGVVFDDVPDEPKHPFASVQNFVRDKTLFDYVVSCIKDGLSVCVTSVF